MERDVQEDGNAAAVPAARQATGQEHHRPPKDRCNKYRAPANGSLHQVTLARRPRQFRRPRHPSVERRQWHPPPRRTAKQRDRSCIRVSGIEEYRCALVADQIHVAVGPLALGQSSNPEATEPALVAVQQARRFPALSM